MRHGAVGDVLLQGAAHTHLPCVDVLAFQLQRPYEADYVLQRHAVAQHARDEFGVVPIFLVELFRETLHGGLVSALVLKLEVVALRAVGVDFFNDASLRHRLGEHDALVVVLQAREDFVRLAVEQTHECHPLVLIVLEAYHVAFQHVGAAFRHLRRAAFGQFGLLVLLLHANHHARARTVAVDGAALAARLPRLHVEAVHEFLVHRGRQVHRHADAVVHPFLDCALHLHLHQPVHVVGRGLIVRRAAHEVLNLLGRVMLLGVDAVGTHPREELMVVNDIFLKGIARLVCKVHAHLGVVGVHLAAARINGQEHRLDARGGLRHQARGTRGGDCEAGNVAAAVLRHVGIELRVGLLDAKHEGIVLFALCVEHLKRAALLRHRHR